MGGKQSRGAAGKVEMKDRWEADRREEEEMKRKIPNSETLTPLHKIRAQLEKLEKEREREKEKEKEVGASEIPAGDSKEKEIEKEKEKGKGKVKNAGNAENAEEGNAGVGSDIKNAGENVMEEREVRVVLVGTGSFSPVHRMHVRMFEAARHRIEAEIAARQQRRRMSEIGNDGDVMKDGDAAEEGSKGDKAADGEEKAQQKQETGADKAKQTHDIYKRYDGWLSSPGAAVVGGFISPSHDHHVHAKLGEGNYIPAQDRVKLCELAVADSEWLAVSSWECSQGLFITFGDVTVEIENFLNASFPRYRFVCFFVCGADLVLRCRLYQGAAAFGVIGVARPEYFAKVKEDMAHIAEYERKGKLDEIGRRGIDRYGNFFMVEEETEDVSSTQIRARIANGESVDDLTFPGVTAYLLKQMKAKN